MKIAATLFSFLTCLFMNAQPTNQLPFYNIARTKQLCCGQYCKKDGGWFRLSLLLGFRQLN